MSIKPQGMLIYDTHTGGKMYVDSLTAIQLVSKIYEDENLGCIKLEQSDLDDEETRGFVDAVVKNGMGKLLDQVEHPIKPVILLPILSLNHDVEKFKNKDNVGFFLTRDISKYLLEVNIMLNNLCQQECQHCYGYCRQLFCCSKEESPENMSKDYLTSLLRQLSYFPVHTINVTGGNIYKYPDLEVFDITDKGGKKLFNFYVHYLNYQRNEYIDCQNIHLIINAPVNMAKLQKVYSLTKGKSVKYHFIVEDDEQYRELESIMGDLGIENFETHPYYNGHNMKFFEENVYLYENDIIDTPLSMREIFRNQKLNANSFGNLYFLPNGDIKANLNERALGHLGKDKIIDAISNEMMQNTAWRKVRSSGPCQNCVYQYLCPPLSDYEKALNRQNLCHVQK